MSTTRAQTVLVLEGGGLRGAFVAGALAELQESGGLGVSHIFATSAGAASAAYMITGQIDRAVHIWSELTHGGQLISALHLLRGRGLMDIAGLVAVFQGKLGLDARRLQESPTSLRVAVTNCNTGAADHVAATESNLFQLLEATMALPVVYGRVVRVQGVPYIDGGVTDAIPLEPALKLEPTRLIVVATRPLGYRKQPAPWLAGLLRHNYRAFPAVWPALRNRSERYNHSIIQLEALERAGRLHVIRPTRALPASRMSRDRSLIVETLWLGRAAARAFLASHAPGPSSQAAGEERKHD